jgi:hypothetical protein
MAVVAAVLLRRTLSESERVAGSYSGSFYRQGKTVYNWLIKERTRKKGLHTNRIYNNLATCMVVLNLYKTLLATSRSLQAAPMFLAYNPHWCIETYVKGFRDFRWK